MRDRVHYASIDGWSVSWSESSGHRFWCLQEQPLVRERCAVIGLNPGSLSGDGGRLARDTTLRVLRRCFSGTRFNPIVFNLFSLAVPKVHELYARWDDRDLDGFLLQDAPVEVSAVLYAYGDYENHAIYGNAVKSRIQEVRRQFSEIPEVVVPTNNNGTPKHAMRYQIENLVPVVRSALLECRVKN